MKKIAAILGLASIMVMAIPAFGGGIVSVSHTRVSIGIGNTSVLTAVSGAKARVLIYLENDSDTTIYCYFGTPLDTNQGIRLAAAGVVGSRLILDTTTGVPQTALTCISAGAAGKNLLVMTGTQP